MKVIFSSITYGPVEPAAIVSQRAAIMHAANNGVQWVGDASPDKETFTVARGRVAAAACETDADYVFWCDSDIILPPDVVMRLLSAEKDFISGIYFQKTGEHWPLIANFAEDHYNWMVLWPENVIAPVDGCGFGCVLTSVKMLRDIRDMIQNRHEENVRLGICDLCESGLLGHTHTECVRRPMTENEKKLDRKNPWFEYARFSEDFEFCQRAKKAGYQLYVDTAILCGHLPPPPAVTFDNFKAKHPEFFGGKENGNIANKQGQQASVVAGIGGSGRC